MLTITDALAPDPLPPVTLVFGYDPTLYPEPPLPIVTELIGVDKFWIFCNNVRESLSKDATEFPSAPMNSCFPTLVLYIPTSFAFVKNSDG